MKQIITSILFFSLSFNFVLGQMKHIVHSKSQDSRILVLEKQSGIYNPLKFRAGDNFTFRMNALKTKYKATLSHIGQNEITVFGTDIPLSAISWIQIDNPHWLVQQGSIYFPVASVGYFAMDMVNPIFSGEESFQFSQQTLITSSAFMLTGIILYLLKKKRYRIYKGFYVLRTESR